MNASQAWVEKLKKSGYKHQCSSVSSLAQIAKKGRIWQETIRRIGINSPASLFELGCGGGRYLAMLALNNFEVHGIDISPAVVERCQNYLHDVEKFSPNPIKVTVECADIFTYNSNKQYDLTYHFGVVEHFLESSERIVIWQKLYQLTKPGGWMMSSVPNGSHFWREHIRQHKLCGYDIPEIDYSVKLHEREFLEIGLQNIIALPWNYFGFLEGTVEGKLQKLMAKMCFLSSNAVLPIVPLPRTFKEKFAHGLLVMGQKLT